MEENSLVKKIRRQGELVTQQVQAFRRSFEFKNVNHLHFTPYLQALQKVSNLNYVYGSDYFQFIFREQLQQILNNNKVLINDLTSKFKFVISLMNKSQVKPLKGQQVNICEDCKQDRITKNIQKAKRLMDQDISISTLRNMMKNLEKQGNILFSQEEDKIFYKHLHRALEVKEEILALRDNHIEQYLQQTIKYLGEIKSIEDTRNQAVQQTPHRIDWSDKIRQDINQQFLRAFKGKVPPWVQKMFDKFLQIYKKVHFKVKQSKGIQTGQYICDQILELRNKIEQLKGQAKQQRCIREQYIQQKQNLQITISLLKTQIDMINQQKMKNIILLHQSKTQSMRNSVSSNKPFDSQNMVRRNQSKFRTQLPNQTRVDSEGRISMNSTINPRQDLLRNQPSLTQHRNSNYQIVNPQKKKKNRKMTDITSLKRGYDQISGFLPDISNGKANGELSRNQLKKLSLKPDQFTTNKYKKDGNFQIQQIQERQELQEFENNAEAKMERLKGYKKRVSIVNQQLMIKRHSTQKKSYKQSSSTMQNLSKQKSNEHKSRFVGGGSSPRTKERIQSSKLNGQSSSSNQQYMQTYRQTDSSNENQSNYQDQTYRQTLLSDRKKGETSQNKYETNKFYTDKIDKNSYKKDMTSVNQNNVKAQSKKQQGSAKVKVQKSIQTQNSQFYGFLKQGSELIQKISIQHLESVAKKLLTKKDNKNKQIKKKLSPTSNIASSQIKSKGQSKTFKKLRGVLTQNYQKNMVQQSMIKKSMHQSLAPTNFQSLNQSIISPQSIKQQNQVKQHKILTKKDFALFLNEETAYQYETSLKKKYHKAAALSLKQKQKSVYTSVYSMIQLIKKHSLQTHKKLLAFIRYPYHTIANDFSIIDIVKQMNLQTFLQYMSRIKHFHKKCQNIGQKCHCEHIEYFIQRIQNILVELTYQNDFDQECADKSKSKEVEIKAYMQQNLHQK